MLHISVFIVIILAMLLVCIDIIHVMRMLFAVFLERSGFKKLSKSVLDVGVDKRICLPFDLDIFMHMNNANYLKHCDIARLQLWTENGVLGILSRLGGSMVLGGSCNRYRRALTLFTKYTINTRVIYWDDTAFYVEHTFVRDSDGFICFISLIKQSVIRIKPEQILEKLGCNVERPDILPELKLWIESTAASSDRLRKKT